MSSSDLELLKHFRKNTEWFDNNYHNLKKYEGQFIAIHKECVVDSDDDSRRLIYRTKRLYDKSLYVSLVTSSGTVSPAKWLLYKLKIIAKRGYGGLYYAPAYLSSPCLNEIALVRFAIDTGATITSISSIDALLNGIDCSKLPSLSPTLSATTPNIHTCFISDCKLGFVFDDNDNLSIDELSQVNVFCDSENITIQSVLGLNLLANYQIHFSNEKMNMILYT